MTEVGYGWLWRHIHGVGASVVFFDNIYPTIVLQGIILIGFIPKEEGRGA